MSEDINLADVLGVNGVIDLQEVDGAYQIVISKDLVPSVYDILGEAGGVKGYVAPAGDGESDDSLG